MRGPHFLTRSPSQIEAQVSPDSLVRHADYTDMWLPNIHSELA